MCSLTKEATRDQMYDDLYWELCILQACAWGAVHVAQNGYDSLQETTVCALLEECSRVMEMFGEIGKC